MNPTRLLQSGAAACLLLAAVPGYYAFTLPWAPRVDFDVTGVLWLLQNVPRLAAILLMAGLLGASATLALRASVSE